MPAGLLTPTHIAIVLIAALLIFGPRRLPQTGRALGSGLRECRHAISGREVESIARPHDDARQEKRETS
ncbi:MAG: twin-arginine translocase TatA/TatE family subunit [Solirubrobacterales bacterium]|nr:twin-arginine translocase TatA/TatE family subunit [Solirubrobacterales bacterium]